MHTLTWEVLPGAVPMRDVSPSKDDKLRTGVVGIEAVVPKPALPNQRDKPVVSDLDIRQSERKDSSP